MSSEKITEASVAKQYKGTYCIQCARSWSIFLLFYPCVLHPVAYEVQIHINIRKRNSVFYYSIISTLHYFISLSRHVSAPRAIIR
jgi:hypothetical protein